jgi:hypothetical protein
MRRGGTPAHPASTRHILELRDEDLSWTEVAEQVPALGSLGIHCPRTLSIPVSSRDSVHRHGAAQGTSGKKANERDACLDDCRNSRIC